MKIVIKYEIVFMKMYGVLYYRLTMMMMSGNLLA